VLAVQSALKTSNRHINCAAVYGNEAEAADAFNEIFSTTDIKRDDVHITSKLWNTAHREEDVLPALNPTCQERVFPGSEARF
jgi:alcohol dehydrogenase (NADP+)